MNKSANQLSSQLQNIGPQLAQRMLDVGIDSADTLKNLGAQAAFLKMYQEGDAYGDFNAAYLYALEGAIQDCDWLDIGDDIKAAHKEFAQALQAQKKHSQ